VRLLIFHFGSKERLLVEVLTAQEPKTYGRYLKMDSLNWLELVQATNSPCPLMVGQ
jgi:hypothetical protein